MDLRTELGADAGQVARARHLLSASLDDWRIGADARETTLLLVSELVTNAIVHGTPPLRLVAFPVQSGVRVEVHDSNPASMPALRGAQSEHPGGRGLRIVEALADRWGSEELAEGKSVWFEVDAKG